MKGFIFLSFLVCLAILLYVIILSQSVIVAIAIVKFLIFLLSILSGISIFGMITGKITFLKMKKRKGSIVLFTASIFFLIYVSGLDFLSVLLEGDSNGKLPSLKKSVSAVTNLFIPVGYKEGLLTDTFDGITFRYPKGEETSVATIKRIYPTAKENLDKIYGQGSTDGLTIMIYGSVDELNSQTKFEHLSGFYISGNRSIHVVSDKSPYRFEDIFFHEYAHYRTDQFCKQHHISMRNIPQWFNEGISEFVVNLHTDVDIDLKEIIKFIEIDSNDDFQAAKHDDFDPYLQSYFAVKELVLAHGVEVIPNLIQATKDKNFYSAFQEITGSKIEVFQTSFLDRRGRIKELVMQAEATSDKKQYENAVRICEEIHQLDPDSLYANRNLPNLYIKQGKFEQAMDYSKEMVEPEFQMLAELSLLTSIKESLAYAEKGEDIIKYYSGDENFRLEFAEVIRNTAEEPVNGYLLLFEKDLITNKEIKTELRKKLKQLYPDDRRIQKLGS